MAKKKEPQKKEAIKAVKPANASLKKKNGKISAVKLWTRRFLDHARQDESEYIRAKRHNFYRSTNATMSGRDLINFYYTIDGYPPRVPIDFRDQIRREARQGVRISFISSFEPTRIDWNSPQIRSKIRTWRNIEEDSDEVTAYNYNRSISAMDSRERRSASLIYLSDAEMRRRRNMFKYRTFMIISGSRGEDFNKTVTEVKDYCKKIGLRITRVDTDLPEFLRAFSPFSAQLSSKIMRQVGSNTLPDEMIARLSTYSQGKIGKEGIMFGTDIFSGFPVYKRIKKSDTDAENILITAETGGGKSFFLKALLLQLLGDDKFNGTINDIEGSEYTPLAGFIANNDNVVILNMAEGEGCYYDPFEVVPTGVEKLDADLFSLSKSFTNSIFRVLIGETLLETNDWAQKIVNNAITLAYTDIGVVEDNPATWGNSRGYDLFYVYSKFKDLYEECISLRESVEDENELELYDRYKLNDGYISTMDKVVAKLSEYFEPFENGGIRSNVFRQKVTLDDIVDAKLLINSFGMEGKSADTVDKTQMALMQLSAANISYLRSVFSKAQGLFNFKVWEEFQRWGQFPGSATTIKTAITGGRKLGDINFIVTNNIKELLDEDRFAIFDNITSFAVGAINSASTRERVCTELSVPQLNAELDAIVGRRGDAESFESNEALSSIYDKAFLISLDKSVHTITKMILPEHIARSSIFKTGVDLKKE